MAEYIANAIQTVLPNQNILFTNTAVCGNNSIMHRIGSGLVSLRGLTNQCRARFRATFSGNIAVSTGETVGPISVAIALNGEAIQSTNMIVTPAAVGDYFNVSSSIFVDIPQGCCANISIRNTSDDVTIDVQNANLIVERVA